MASTIMVSRDGGPMVAVAIPEGATHVEANAALAEAGFGLADIRVMSPEEARAEREHWADWNAPEAVLTRKKKEIELFDDDDLRLALEFLRTVAGPWPRHRRRAAERHPLREFVPGGLLPREIDVVHSYLTAPPESY